MKEEKDDLKGRLSELSELSFSDDLRERILKQASLQSVSERTKRLHTKNWLVGLSGFVAACLVIGVLLFNHLNDKISPNPTTASSQPKLAVNDFGLVNAPLVAVSYEVLPPKLKGGSAVLEATLKNIGSSPLSKDDVFAVVSFEELKDSTSPSLQLVTGKFLAFANGPTREVPAGGVATWTFGTFGIPFVNNDLSSLQPEVNFYYSKLSSTNYSLVWHKATNILVSKITQNPNLPIGDGYSVTVNATLENTGKKPIPLNQLAAIVYYGSDWTDWRNVRTLNSIRVAGQSTIPSGESLPVTFHLIGPNVPLFVDGQPKITVVWKSSSQG